MVLPPYKRGAPPPPLLYFFPPCLDAIIRKKISSSDEDDDTPQTLYLSTWSSAPPELGHLRADYKCHIAQYDLTQTEKERANNGNQ